MQVTSRLTDETFKRTREEKACPYGLIIHSVHGLAHCVWYRTLRAAETCARGELGRGAKAVEILLGHTVNGKPAKIKGPRVY